MPRARVIRYLRNQLGDNYDKGEWQDQIDSSLSDDENIRILGDKIRAMGLGRKEYSYQDIQRMSADEISQASGVPVSRQYDQSNLLQSSGNIMATTERRMETPEYVQDARGYLVPKEQILQKKMNLKKMSAEDWEKLRKKVPQTSRITRALKGLISKDKKFEKKVVKTMGQARGRLLPGIKVAAKGLTYGYQDMPNRNPVGRPRGKYKHFIPGVGFVPVQQYRAYLRKARAQQYAQMDAEQFGQQVTAQQVEQAPQQAQPRTPWSRTVDFSRKDFNLMRQDENLNLLRDMRSQQEYEYTDVNMISGEAVKKKKVMDMGFF